MKILIVDPGPQSGKERFLRELTSNPYEFFLLVNSSPRVPTSRWYSKYIPSTHVISADFRNAQEAAKSVRAQLTAHGIRLSGVTTYYEFAVLIAQAIAEELSLTPITTGDPLPLRNKGLMRLHFSAAGLPQPRSIICRTLKETKQAVEQIGIPCVVKPSQIAASVGVRKVSSREDDIDSIHNMAFTGDIPEEDIRFSYNIPCEVIVEEYISTYQEISCEGFAQRGRVQILAITRKSLGPEPVFEEIGHATPFQVTDETRRMVEEQLNRAAIALKLYSTAFHAEFRLRPEAPPVLIELGARLPGGFVPQLMRLSQGIDMFQVILQLATEQEYNPVPHKTSVAGIRFFLDEDITRKFAVAAPQIRSLPFVDEATVYQSAGTGRRGHVIWTARDFNELEDSWGIISALY